MLEQDGPFTPSFVNLTRELEVKVEWGALFSFQGGMEHPESCAGIRWIFMDAVAKRDSMVPILCGNSDSDLP